MKLKFIAPIEIAVTLTKEEFDYIFQGAATHYSHDCKSMTEVGGELYGWKNSWEFRIRKNLEIEEHVTTRFFTNRDFQLLIKSIEFDYSPMAVELQGKLWKVLSFWAEMQAAATAFMEANQPAAFDKINVS